MNKPQLKAVIAGAGMMGQVHADAIRRIPFAGVAAISSTNADKLRGQAEEMGIPGVYQDFDEMLKNERPDVVHICTPNNMHFEMCKKSIESGCHVFCEKPLALTAREGEILSRLAAEKRVGAAVNFNYRNNAAVREIRERVSAGEAGELYLVHGSYLQDWLMYDSDYSWRLDREKNGASRAIADIGSHWFDTVQFATGHKIAEVFAKTFTAINKRKKPLASVRTFQDSAGASAETEVNTEDGAMVMFRLDNGVPGSVTISQVSGGHKNGLEFELDCSNYSMFWNQEDADKLWVASRKGGKQVIYSSPSTLHPAAGGYDALPEGHAGNWRDALFNSVSSFYKALEDGSFQNEGRPYSTFSDATNIIRIVEACLESSARDEWIKI